MAKRYRAPTLDAPPMYTTTRNETIPAFVQQRRRRAESASTGEVGHVAGSKTSAAYRAHSYHTKVPPEGIVPFIERYSRPGDVVLDPFCGSGMTGVAAASAGRRAVLVDLSPAATFIASNYVARPDADRLREEAERVVAAVADEIAPLYVTRCRACGGAATLTMTVWSDRFACPECGKEFLLWDVARGKRRVAEMVKCPGCRRSAQRSNWDRRGQDPVLVKYRCSACGTAEAEPDERDREAIAMADAGNWESRVGFPRTPIPRRGDEIARVHRKGISRVDQLFTRRNLRALASLWQAVGSVRGLTCRQQLYSALTGSMPRASRTNKYIPALGVAPGPILGTMYIPGFHPEVNVLSLFRRKVEDLARYYESARPHEDAVRVSTQSATDLRNIPDRSVDYAFTDPPFGANIAYSELNFLWEAWLGARTVVRDEAIVSRTQKKSVADYSGIMAQAFREVARVLKRGGRFSIVFHNTSAEVWQALQAAIDDAGLAVEAAVTFDKGTNQSFKQFTAEGAVTHDLVVTCRRRSKKKRARVATEDDVRDFVRAAQQGRRKKLDARRLYSTAIAHFLVEGMRVPVGFAEFRKFLR
jgi:DNA modification methylase